MSEVEKINMSVSSEWYQKQLQLEDKQNQLFLIEQMLTGANGRVRLSNTILDHYQNSAPELNLMTIINAPTGGGKTHSIVNHLLPKMMEDEVSIINLISPDTSVYDKDTLRRLCNRNGYKFIVTPHIYTQLEEYLHDCETDNLPIKVLIFGHNSNFHKTVGKDTVGLMLDYTQNIATIVDEVHLTMTSSYENYQNNNGNKPPSFDANMYESISTLAKYCPIMYGISATPTPEQDINYPNGQHISPMGDMKYKVLDIGFTINDRLVYNSYMAKPVLYNTECYDECENTLENALNCHFDKLNKLKNNDFFEPVPMSMMIFAARDGSKHGLGVSDIISYIARYCLKNDIFNNLKLPCVLMNGQGTYEYKLTSNKGNPYFEPSNFENISSSNLHESRRALYKALDNPHHHASIVIVVDVGGVGININSLKTLLCFRGNDATGINNEGLHGKPTQKLGRGSRINITPSQKAEIDKHYNGSLELWWKSLTKVEIRRYIDANTINTFLPSTTMVNEALQLIDDRAMLGVEIARKLINHINSKKLDN